MMTNISLPQFDRDRHGSLYDRGSADAYYSRRADPHWYPNGTYNGCPVTNLTPEEVTEYMVGYNGTSDRKEW